jgi:replicative DNA helicase
MQELKNTPQNKNSFEVFDKDVDILKLSDEGIERATIACLMIDPSKMMECSTSLTPDDFINVNNKYLYDIMLALYKKNGAGKCSFDLASIMSIAESKGIKETFIQKSGGEEYIEFLNNVKNSMVDINRFTHYVARLTELNTKRKILSSLNSFKQDVVNSDKTADELAVMQRNAIDQILISSTSKEFEVGNIGDGATLFVEEAFKAKKSLIGISTGYKELDAKIEGLRKGTLTIVQAPRKTGKTSFLMNIGINTGIKKTIPTLMISTEMSDEEIRWRIIASLSGVAQNKIIKGALDDNERQKVRQAAQQLEKANFHHITMRGFTLDKLIGIVRKFTSNVVGFDYAGNVRECLIIFDYIKLPQAEIKSAKDLKEHKLLGSLADGLKILAGDLQIPIFSACQTNRAGDIASSYEMTWFCDTLMELTKKSDKEMEKDSLNNMFLGNQKLKITANRGAEEDHCGINLNYDGPTLTYSEITNHGFK